MSQIKPLPRPVAPERRACAGTHRRVGALGLIAFAAAPAAHAVCYVAATATGADTGASWRNAYTSLQGALQDGACAEVWVATGTYKPVVPADPGNVTAAERMTSFAMRPGLAVYGGFAGSETSRGQRNPTAHPTILSGDLAGDDSGAGGGVDAGVPTDGSNAENSLHVLIIDGTTTPVTAGTVLDGFTITAGNANGSDAPGLRGGGLYCDGGNGECSPTLANLVFSGNHAGDGGALFDNADSGGTSSPALTHVAFEGNSAEDGGGALYNYANLAGTSSPALSDVNFSGNSAAYDGGALSDIATGGGESSPVLTGVTFSGNAAARGGGALYNWEIAGTSSPVLTQVTFSGNSAGSEGGGAISNIDFGGPTGVVAPALTNVTFSGNTSSGNGGAIYDDAYGLVLTNVTFSGNSAGSGGAIFQKEQRGPVPVFTNVVFWGDTAGFGAEIDVFFSAKPRISHSIVQGSGGSANWDTSFGVDGGGNLDVDPLLGALAGYGGDTQTMLPAAGSPAVDAGDDAVCPATDQRGRPRSDGHCDIGAVERQPGDPADPEVVFTNGFDG